MFPIEQRLVPACIEGDRRQASVATCGHSCRHTQSVPLRRVAGELAESSNMIARNPGCAEHNSRTTSSPRQGAYPSWELLTSTSIDDLAAILATSRELDAWPTLELSRRVEPLPPIAQHGCEVIETTIRIFTPHYTFSLVHSCYACPSDLQMAGSSRYDWHLCASPRSHRPP